MGAQKALGGGRGHGYPAGRAGQVAGDMQHDDSIGATAAGDAGGTILIHVQAPLFRAADGTLLLEDQACNGLRLWSANFGRVLVTIPLAPGPPPQAWVPLSRVGPSLERIEFEILPWAWRLDQFLRHLGPVRRRMRGLIARADYLGFAFGGLFGDWGAVGAIEARRMGRAHYVWADRVESAITRDAIRSGANWRRRMKARLFHRPMAALERYLVRHAELGLFHGRETYDHFAPFSANPQLVHDVHIRATDHLPEDRRAAKIAGAAEGPLRIVYVGRADPMKGPLEWIEAMRILIAEGVDFRATWLGEGEDLARMRQAAAAIDPQGERISLPGFARDRAAVLEGFRSAHVLAFCHKTPESPRCLIESLISATPIVGYEGAFARDLISGHGGGIMVPGQDPVLLARELAGLAADRAKLGELIARAALDGAPFSDEAVFHHRSEVIRANLPRG